jgi:hypothetical protein
MADRLRLGWALESHPSLKRAGLASTHRKALVAALEFLGKMADL